VIIVSFVVQPVTDGCNPPDDLAAALSHEVLGLRVLEEWILLAGE
jgi:hypothetical protein